MVFEKTFGESQINNIPYGDGEIFITFVRIYPTFKVIPRRIALCKLSKEFNTVSRDLKRSGINLSLQQAQIRICDYHLFVKKLFPEMDVYDDQNNREGRKGRPDFRLSNKEGEFYIEFKKSYDDIRTSQLIWIGENPNKEVWFLLEGQVDFEDPRFNS